jgi:uncharacterized protein (TIGR03000 family)
VPVVVAALLWAAGPVLARGPGGGFHGGGFHGGHVATVHGGGFHGAHIATVRGGGFHGGHFGTFHGGGFRGGFHDGRFANFGHFGRGWHGGWGRGWGYGLGLGYYGGYPYSYGGYGAYPSYYGSYSAYPYYSGGYSVPDYNYLDVEPYGTAPDSGSYYNSGPDYTTPTVPQTATTVPSTPTDTTAHIDVRVPAGTEVWVEGAQTKQTGELRHFVSPPLTPGQEFVYDIRARWTDANGQVVDQTRHVQVHAGSQVVENFTAPAPGQ